MPTAFANAVFYPAPPSAHQATRVLDAWPESVLKPHADADHRRADVVCVWHIWSYAPASAFLQRALQFLLCLDCLALSQRQYFVQPSCAEITHTTGTSY